MPRRSPVAAVAVDPSLSKHILIAVIGLLASLIGTGIVSMISLHVKVAQLSDDIARTDKTLNKHLEHSVDKDDYLRRDAQIQRALDNMATKDELRDLTNAVNGIRDSLEPHRTH